MHSAILSLRGVVSQFNLSPKGVPEGLLLRLDGRGKVPVVQVNFDPELAGAVTQVAAEGEPVTADAAPFADAVPDAHPVYALVRLTTAAGRSVVADGPAEGAVTVRGTVVRINHARRGEPNGGILDTGDFVHLRPHGARAVGLHVGQVIDAAGEVRGGWSGHRVVEARVANGVDIGKPPKPAHPKPPKHGHRPPHHAPPVH